MIGNQWSFVLPVLLLSTVAPLRAQEYQFITIPEQMRPVVRGIDVQELAARYATKDPEAVATVDAVLKRAEAYQNITAQWWIERTAVKTPLGMWTTACPFHPEQVKDFSSVSWRTSLDEPFRLYCPLCQKEGRKYAYYPNPDYPDDGTGCYPTDEVWKRTHGPEWGKQHPGIPWDHWNGKPHGYSAAGYAYFFRGKWHHTAHMGIAKAVLPALGEAYQVAAHVLPPDEPRAAKAEYFARAVQMGLLTIARAHLGDTYLRDVLGHGEEQYAQMLASVYDEEVDAGYFPGYLPYTLFDGLYKDEKHPARYGDIYCDGSQFGDAYANGWLRGFALVRNGYTQKQVAAGAVHATECVLAAHPEDEERLQAAGSQFKLKYGKLDYHHRPYTMLAYHNLHGRLLESQFRLGRLFGDQRIVDITLRNFHYYLRGYDWGDGHGEEGSPAYTNCAWGTMSYFLETIRGYQGDFGPDHRWWDERTGGLNLYRDQDFCNSLAEAGLTCLPNGCQIAWEDSHAATRPPLRFLAKSLQAGAKLPDDCRDFYTVTGVPGHENVTLKDPAKLPSYLLHNNRKVVFRLQHQHDTDVLALDYTWRCGHWHYAPLSLVYYAQGQEVLTDQGYLGAMHWCTREWIKHCPAHNCCTVRNADGDHTVTRSLRGEPTGVMADCEWVQVAEVAERLPIKLEQLGENGCYGRTVALIDCGEASYTLDIFRVRGAATHEWYLHADGERLSIAGADMGAVKAENLADLLGVDHRASRMSLQHVKNLHVGQTDGDFAATWSPLRTWASGEKVVSDDKGYRCTMLGSAGTELITGTAPGQRYTDNRDLGTEIELLCVRRPNTDALDEFVAVHEAYQGTPFIKKFQRLPAAGGIVAVSVDRGDAADYVLSAHWDQPVTEAVSVDTPDGAIRFTASFAALTVVAGQVTRGMLLGAGTVSLGSFSISTEAELSGRLLSFDDEADYLLIEADNPWPAGDVLADQWGFIRHEHGVSTFTVRSVEPDGEGRYKIHLKYTPHLAICRVLASGVLDAKRIMVEPMPNVPRDAFKPSSLGFYVYRQLADRLELVGAYERRSSVRLKDEYGYDLGPPQPLIVVDGDTSQVKAGHELAISRLRPGQDTVFITPCCSTQNTEM